VCACNYIAHLLLFCSHHNHNSAESVPCVYGIEMNPYMGDFEGFYELLLLCDTSGKIPNLICIIMGRTSFHSQWVPLSWIRVCQLSARCGLDEAAFFHLLTPTLCMCVCVCVCVYHAFSRYNVIVNFLESFLIIRNSYACGYQNGPTVIARQPFHKSLYFVQVSFLWNGSTLHKRSLKYN
jgi:hypothetical protein